MRASPKPAKSSPSSTAAQRNPESEHNWLEEQTARIKRRTAFTAVVLVFTVVAAIGTFTDALDGISSQLLDRCRQASVCEPEPPMWLVGTLSEVRLGAANVPLHAASEERGFATPVDQPLGWPGRFITYRVEFRGMRGAVCYVRWTLIDAATQERVDDQWAKEEHRPSWETIHADAYPDKWWIVEADTLDAAIGTLWVPYLAPGNYMVEVELVDADDVYLDIERTPVFTIRAKDLPAQ